MRFASADVPVVDASVVVEYLGRGEHRAPARASINGGELLWAPHLIDAEVGHVLRRSVLASEMSVDAAKIGLVGLVQLPLRRAPHAALLNRAWELRDNLSFYDALYIALAEALDVPLVTFDARLARAPGSRADVEVLG